VFGGGIMDVDVEDGVREDDEEFVSLVEQNAIFESVSHIQSINALIRMYKEEIFPHPAIPADTIPTR
jgi:hypothetical protein